MYFLIDTETTGKRYQQLPYNAPEQPWCCQVAAMLVRPPRTVVFALNTLVLPQQWFIPHDAYLIHGISTEKAAQIGIPFRRIVDILDALLNAFCLTPPTLVGHNVSFDRDMLLGDMSRSDVPDTCYFHEVITTQSIRDTMHESTPICRLPGRYGKPKWPRLSEAYRYFMKRDLPDAHDAFVDLNATLDILVELDKIRNTPV